MKMRILLTCFTLLSATSGLSKVVEKSEAEQALSRATTWYWHARARANDLDSFAEAAAEYEAILRAANLSRESCDVCDDRTLTCAACDGLQQLEASRANSWNTYRNVYPAVWWLAGEDPTHEFYEDDTWLTALQSAWSLMSAGLVVEQIPRTSIIIRCFDRSNDEPAFEGCEQTRDEFLAFVSSNPRFDGISNQAGRRLLGPNWPLVLSGQQMPTSEMVETISRTRNAARVLVVDATYWGKTTDGDRDIFRVGLKALKWVPEKQAFVGISSTSGVVESRLKEESHDVTIVVLMGLGLVLFLAANRRILISAKSLTVSSVLSLVLFVVGMVWARYAIEISAPFLMEWEDVALSLNGESPRVRAMAWTFIYGVLLLIVPVAAIVLVNLRLFARIEALLGRAVSLEIWVPSALAGCIAGFWAPYLRSAPTSAYPIVFLLGSAAWMLSYAVAPAAQQLTKYIRGGSELTEIPSRSIAIAIGWLVCASILLPVGLYENPGVTGQVDAVQHGHIWISLMAFGAAILMKMSFSSEDGSLVANDKGGAVEVASAEVRFGKGLPWVQRESLQAAGYPHLEAFRERCQTGYFSFYIDGPTGGGKTRCIDELHSLLGSNGWRVGRANARRPLEQHAQSSTVEPFGVVSDALAMAFGLTRVSASLVRAEQAAGLIENVADFPGLGLLVQATQVSPAQTRAQVFNDIRDAVVSRASKCPLAMFFDDLHWSDESSLELLLFLNRELSRLSFQYPVIFVFASRTEQNTFDVLGELSQGCSRLHFSALTANEELEILEETLRIQGAELERFVDALHSLLGERSVTPLEVAMVLRGLETAKDNLWTTDESGRGRLVIDPKLWAKHVPPEARTRVEKLLKSFTEDEMLLLECAAETGRMFTATTVAAGIGRPRLQVLQALRQIEEKSEIVEDIERDEDLFRFDSELTRDVLRSRVQPDGRVSAREIAREMHYGIAKKLIEVQSGTPSFELLEHCLLAGNRLRREAAVIALGCVEISLKRFAYREARELLVRIDELGLATMLNEEEINRLDFAHARSLHGGGQSNRDDAAETYLRLIEQSSAPSFELLLAYLENRYEEKEKAELQKLYVLCEKWLADQKFHALFNQCALRFFSALCRSHDLPGSEPLAGEAFQDEMAKLMSSLSELPETLETRTLLARIYQERANDFARRKDLGEPEKYSSFLLWSERSKELKQKIGDLEGLALNVGQHGAYLLYSFIANAEPDDEQLTARADQAYALFTEDIQVMERLGNDADRAGLLNKRAMTRLFAAKSLHLSNTEKQAHREQAIRDAEESLRLSLALEREQDSIFSACTILEWLDPDEIDWGNSLVVLGDRKVWEKITLKSLPRKADQVLSDAESKCPEHFRKLRSDALFVVRDIRGV